MFALTELLDQAQNLGQKFKNIGVSAVKLPSLEDFRKVSETVLRSYGLEQWMVDVWVMLVAGLVGFVLKRYGFAPAPIIMG